ncbi:hypothetical protein P4159_05620 [Bacillus thuringiensis]|uniref:hypothetical protein n=1 Tax=Bacillus cereus group TaxID=86661 RepID=UPI000CD88CAC|nr:MULTISPECIES: hypothetical protein [Bacillus cereus group]MEC3420520.1 hypothetical protein [Bacillus cereus]MEC3596930.1 hypothetical protein [Bacillus thuringiensis]MED1574279.1 hypothetical protein [Bacillus paranthracis]MED1836203.1 hypothetical protein [Bacillus thuringiensis]MED2670266.1 hypothetical protein [Bacillus thuringiensis]
MLRKIQAACMIVGFGIISFLQFTKGHYFVGSLVAFCVFTECLVMSGIGNGETTIKVSIGRGENK